MTSLDANVLRNKFRSTAFRSAMRSLPGSKSEPSPTHIGQDALHLLGKFEEVTAKGLGGVFSDDPKYDDIFGSSTYWNQVGFFENFRDLGMNQENMGALGPFAAGLFGMAAAFANPFDPLNKFRAGALTRRGVAGKRVFDAIEAGSDTIRYLKNTKKMAALNDGKGLAQLNKEGLINSLREKEALFKSAQDIEDVARRSTKGRLTADDVAEFVGPRIDVAGTKATRKAHQRSIKDLQSSVDDVDQTNKVLEHLQTTAGLSVDQIKLADSTGDQIRLGQRDLFGLSSPRKLDQLSIFGVHKDELSMASTISLPGRKAQAAFAEAVGGLGGKAMAGMRSVAATVTGGRVGAMNKRMQEAVSMAQDVVNIRQGNKAMMKSDLDNLRERLGLTREQMYEVVNHVEAPNDLKYMARSVIDEMPQVGDFENLRTAERILEVTKDEDAGPIFGNMVPGSRLTRNQVLATTPSGLDPVNDLPNIIDEINSGDLPGKEFGDSGAPHTLYNLSDHVVVKLNPNSDVADFNSLNQIYGIRAYSTVKNGDDTLLVMKKMPAVGEVSATNQLTETHLANLVGIAKELGLRGKAFSDLSPEDIMINAMGGVQIINPTKIVTLKVGAKRTPQGRFLAAGKAAQQKAAMQISQRALEVFADNDTLIPRGSGRNFAPLQSAAAARRAPLHAAFRGDKKVGLGRRANIDDLLVEAVNAGPERDFMRGLIAGEDAASDALQEFARANGIEAEFAKNFERLQQGKPLHIDPVVVTFGHDGQLYIRDGFERAVAAKMLGADFVPITIKKSLGDVPDNTRQFFLGPSHKILDVHRAQGTNGLDKLTGPFQELGSGDYRVVQNGNYIPIREDIHQVATEPGSALLAASSELAAVGIAGGEDALATRKTMTLQSILANVGRTEDGRFLSRGEAQANASLLLATAAEESKDFKDFADRLRQMTKNSKTNRMINLDNLGADPTAASDIFERVIKPRAKAYLDDLAESGYLRNSDLDNTSRLNKAMEGVGGGEIIIARPHSLEVHSSRRTSQELNAVADRVLKQTTNVEDIEPLGRVILKGVDEPIIKEVNDFVTTPHPRLQQTSLPGTRFEIGDDELDLWRRTHGIVRVSDTMSDVDKGILGLKVGGRLLRSDDRTLPFFMTLSGDLFVSGKHGTVDEMLKDAFGGRGPFYSVETGIMSSDGLVVDGLLGTQRMQKMGKAELRVLKGRMQHISKQFKAMGVADDVKIKFNMPFDESVWEGIYGTKVRLGNVVKPGFRMKIPDMMLDIPLDNHVRVSGARRPRFKNPRQQVLFTHIEKTLDDIGVEEFKRGLVNGWHESYFHRILTPEAQKAMNEIFTKLTNKDLPGGLRTLKAMQGFLKKRMFTDLTTKDVNDLFLTIQQHTKGTWNSQEEMLGALVNKIKEDYKLTLSPEKLKQYTLITDSMPSGALFFNTDAITATKVRFGQSQDLLKQMDIIDIMTESGAAMHLSIEDFKALQSARGTKGLLAKFQDPLDAKRKEVSDKLADVSNDPGNEVLVREAADLDLEAQALKVAYDDAEKAIVDKYGGMAMDYDTRSGSLHISNTDAQRMLREGKISVDDLEAGRGIDDALVELPVEKFINKLEKDNVKVVLFTEQGKLALDRFISVQSNTGFGKALKFYDKLLNIFRMNVLFPIPAFHGRNVFSIFWQAHLGGMNSPKPFIGSMRIMKVLGQKQRGIISLEDATRLLDNMTFPTQLGTQKTGREILEEFHRRGGFMTPSSNEYVDFGKPVRVDEFERNTKRLGGIPSVSEQAGSIFDDNILVRQGLKLSNMYESRARLAGFLHELERTGDFKKAEKFFKEIFYDYSNLNAFERDWMRRTIPFYNWFRHNTPRMLKTMATQPVKHVRFMRMLHQIEQGVTERMPPDESAFPDWFRRNFGMILFKQKDGKYFIKSGEGLFPMVDVYKMLAGGPSGIIETGVNAFTPIFKFPVEQLLNKSFFTGRNISGADNLSRDFAFQRLGFTRRTSVTGPLGPLNVVMNDSFIRNFFRLGSEASLWLSDLIDPKRWLDGKPAASVAMWDFVLGRGKMVDPESARAVQMMNMRRDRGSLRRAYKYYKDRGNEWYANEIQRLMFKIDLEFGSK